MSATRRAWFNCSAGVAGDMMLGALLDAGASLEVVRSAIASTGLTGWSVDAEQVSRAGIRATKAVVSVEHDGTTRAYATIRSMLEGASLPDRVAMRSLAAFAALANAEAQLHGVSVDEVHFHEVGGHDAIIDVVGTMAALDDLDISHVGCSAIGTGAGTVGTEHGRLPNPAPATVALLRGFDLVGVPVEVELATPTGAALLRALAPGSSPPLAMTLEAQGFGAGTRDLDGRANVVGVLIGTAGEARRQLSLIETTVDDVTGEHLAAALGALMEAGALDAWITSVVMKKGRPGFVLSVLCAPEDDERLGALLTERTGSLGARHSLIDRHELDRELAVVEVLGHEIRIKHSKVKAKPEFDDVERVAQATNKTLAEIDALAIAAWVARSASS